MFGLGLPEILVILVIALLVLGPKRLPEAARSLGRGMAEFRRASADLRNAISQPLDEPEPAPRSSGNTLLAEPKRTAPETTVSLEPPAGIQPSASSPTPTAAAIGDAAEQPVSEAAPDAAEQTSTQDASVSPRGAAPERSNS